MLIELNCDKCNKIFARERGEVNRSKKLGRGLYCSRSCGARIDNIPLEKRGQISYLRPNNRLDEFSPFRSHFRSLKNRNKVIEVTLKDLKDIWDNQNGICPISGHPMLLSRTSIPEHIDSPYRASLDRVDSTIGYTKSNIRWICVIANYAKNGFTDKQLINFCRSVSQNNHIL